MSAIIVTDDTSHAEISLLKGVDLNMLLIYRTDDTFHPDIS